MKAWSLWLLLLAMQYSANADAAEVSAGQHLSQVFDEASRENRGIAKAHDRRFGSWATYGEPFPQWSLNGRFNLRRSLALNSLSLQLGSPYSEDRSRRDNIQAYLRAAAGLVGRS
jgi:hypothetical protein